MMLPPTLTPFAIKAKALNAGILSSGAPTWIRNASIWVSGAVRSNHVGTVVLKTTLTVLAIGLQA